MIAAAAQARLGLGILLLVAATGCAPTTSEPPNPPPSTATATPTPAPTTSPGASETIEDGVVATYFHGHRRCPTCRGMQETIEKTVEERFADELAAGKLRFREIDFEDEANRGYVPRYDLASSTLVVSTWQAGQEIRWVNCDQVWEFALDHAKLADYTQARIREALAAPGK